MLCFDAEINRAIIDLRKEDPVGDIEYCKGWGDFAGMGIACVCSVDHETGIYRVFCEDNFYELQNEMDRHGVIVGFNNQRFDDRLLLAHGVVVGEARSYDLLLEILIAAGNNNFSPNAFAGYNLDAVARANLGDGAGKQGHGKHAPILWQRGCIGSVISYCLRDVWILHALIQLLINRGYLICPKSGERLNVRLPDEVREKADCDGAAVH